MSRASSNFDNRMMIVIDGLSRSCCLRNYYRARHCWRSWM